MKSAVLLPGILACLVLIPSTALADGSLPPLPYHYLHPPPALAGGNKRPVGVNRTVIVASGNLTVFTPDGQAGIALEPQTLGAAKTVAVSIHPVDTPPGIPSDLAADGNAYDVHAVAQPGGRLAHGLSILTLRFPHIPTGIYRHTDHWMRACSNIGGAIISSATITCRVPPEGVFVAVTSPQNAGVSPPPASPIKALGPYIAIIAAGLLILATLLLAFLTTRRKPAEEQ